MHWFTQSRATLRFSNFSSLLGCSNDSSHSLHFIRQHRHVLVNDHEEWDARTEKVPVHNCCTVCRQSAGQMPMHTTKSTDKTSPIVLVAPIVHAMTNIACTSIELVRAQLSKLAVACRSSHSCAHVIEPVYPSWMLTHFVRVKGFFVATFGANGMVTPFHISKTHVVTKICAQLDPRVQVALLRLPDISAKAFHHDNSCLSISPVRSQMVFVSRFTRPMCHLQRCGPRERVCLCWATHRSLTSSTFRVSIQRVLHKLGIQVILNRARRNLSHTPLVETVCFTFSPTYLQIRVHEGLNHLIPVVGVPLALGWLKTMGLPASLMFNALHHRQLRHFDSKDCGTTRNPSFCCSSSVTVIVTMSWKGLDVARWVFTTAPHSIFQLTWIGSNARSLPSWQEKS